MSNQAPSNSPPIPWPLTFDEFTFGTMVFNTLHCQIFFEQSQLATDLERVGPSGPPPSPNWKDRWSGFFIVGIDRMPPGPVVVAWTSVDGMEHKAEIDLIKGIFPEQIVLHNVAKEDVNEDWVRFEGGKTSGPDILMEVNDRTINIYMKEMVLTKLPPDPERPDIVSRNDLVLAWTRTY